MLSPLHKRVLHTLIRKNYRIDNCSIFDILTHYAFEIYAIPFASAPSVQLFKAAMAQMLQHVTSNLQVGVGIRHIKIIISFTFFHFRATFGPFLAEVQLRLYFSDISAD